MKAKTILSIFALLSGEAIIIASFCLWRGVSQGNIWVLNLSVTSIVYMLFAGILLPWVDLNDRAQRKVAGIGLKWLICGCYMVLAVSAMVLCNTVCALSFQMQLIIHCCLLFSLLLGGVGVLHTSDKVGEVYCQDLFRRQGVEMMRRVVADLQETVQECQALPVEYADRIGVLEENLRYLSPADTQEVRSLEKQFVEVIQELMLVLPGCDRNKEKIEVLLNRAERICRNRKSMYSN